MKRKKIYKPSGKQNVFSRIPFLGLFAVLFLCLFLAGPAPGHAAANVTLTWDKNTEADLAGYVVYTGTSSGSYTETLDVGNMNSVDISGLQEGATYYYAAKAYNTSGLYSEYSNEVSYNVPVTTYTLTASGGPNGTISPSGAISVSAGAGQTFTIAPASGYTIASVSVDGVNVGAPGSYTFSNVTANHTISATFAPVAQYTIAPSSGSGGTISPSETVSLSSGASQTYTITPNDGYTIASVSVDGVHMGTPGSYTFSNVIANHTISAAFAPVATYTIAASINNGGTISPSGTVSLSSGASQSYSITPASGYKIAKVTVDGVDKGVLTAYTFSNVTANHSIKALFRKK
ncbi:MAG: hypothetical protein RBR16_06715 [Syntrophus sp. (in: bacteria)]|nr:hypothetical protein [Syntrophus sp. (in: bacteria)]